VSAGRLARAVSTLSREVERNGGRTTYRACAALSIAFCCSVTAASLRSIARQG